MDVEAIVAPSVPPSTIIAAGMLIIDSGVPPSMKIAPISMKMERPMPMAVTAFMRFRGVRWRRG